MPESQTETRESSSLRLLLWSEYFAEYFELIYDRGAIIPQRNRTRFSAKVCLCEATDICSSWNRVVSSTLAISRESNREFSLSLSLSRRVLSLGNLSPFNSGNDKKRNGVIYDLEVRFSCWLSRARNAKFSSNVACKVGSSEGTRSWEDLLTRFFEHRSFRNETHRTGRMRFWNSFFVSFPTVKIVDFNRTKQVIFESVHGR